MTTRDLALHKADLLLSLDAEGKPLELHHALRVVQAMREALLITTSHEVVENTDCTAFVPLYFVRHPDGTFSPAAPQPVERSLWHATLKDVADAIPSSERDDTDELLRLRAALADYEADAIHTCGPDCRRPLCVLRAELAALRAQEPVAWRHRWSATDCWFVNTNAKIALHAQDSGADVQLLYAAPVPPAVPDAHDKALKAALDFIGTVAPGASWWDDVWPEHEAALLAAAQKKDGNQS